MFDKGHRMGNDGGMAVDFDALDLVRSQNRSREYNKKLNGLQQENRALQELAQEMVDELPEEKKIPFQEKLNKISS